MKPASAACTITFDVTLRTAATGAERRLRRALKTMLRRDRLHCISVLEYPSGGHPPRRAGSVNPAVGAMAMGIGKRVSGSNFMPTIKYDARVGMFHIENRVQGEEGWQTEQKDVTEIMRTQGAIIDLGNGGKGWIKFVKGAAPDMVLVPFGEDHDPGKQPTPDHKEGVRLIVKLPGDVPRELLNTAAAFWDGIDELYSKDFEEQRKGHPGKVPVVILTSVFKNKTKNGTAFIPTLVIGRWVPRPPDLPAGGIDPQQAKPAQHPDLDDLDDGGMDYPVRGLGDEDESEDPRPRQYRR